MRGAGSQSRGEPDELPMDGHAISSGPFRLLAAQRLLLEGDRPVRLDSRAFDRDSACNFARRLTFGGF